MATDEKGPRRHKTRALLRAHLAAAAVYRHTTRHCPICHRLLRLALETPAEPHEGVPQLVVTVRAREPAPVGRTEDPVPQ